ncbi:probable histone-lysine N-methyltransferase Mes-4 [Culex pipiens pallens]|uniref:probable histone-lysine N-methyltransferase Mes-4 n=1 Tax=Culex pipiens pallens TaxID=42434 RepID=UPI001953F4C4|nr:probable histone-lysine N-methyltransferase Mes-4 [Culex pipiens pallens]
MGRKARNKTRIRPPPLESGPSGDAMDSSAEVDFEQMLETSVITRSGLRNGQKLTTPVKSSPEVVRQDGTSPTNKETVTPKRTKPALRSPAPTRVDRDDSKDKMASPPVKSPVESPQGTPDNKDVNGNDTSSAEQDANEPVNPKVLKTYSRTPAHARSKGQDFGTPRRLRTFTSSPLKTHRIPPKQPGSAPSTPKLTPADVEDRLKSPERSRYLLKQLESSLSPKFTQPAKTSSVHVSRYGRIQKQKENADYIPLDVAKFITKSPPKAKVNPVVAVMKVAEEPVEEEEQEEVIQIIKTEPEGGDDEADIVPIDQIQIVDLDVSLSESLAAVEPDPVKVEMEKSSDADSARGSSIDLDTAGSAVGYKLGQVFWGAFHAKTIHWPCMIYPNPEDGQLTLVKKNKTVVHVVFFADNGRRGWIAESTLLPFGGLEEYKSLIAAKFKPLKNKLTTHLKRQTWIDAIRQAEEVQGFPIEARDARFQELLEAELAAKPKAPMRKRAMSISAGYHSNSLDESFESREKRLRSPTPESPMYEELPVKNKRIKLEASADDVISRYFQSMKDGSLESTSATGSECSDEVLSAAELAGLDRDEYNSYLLGMNRSYDAIMLAQAGRARTSHRLRTQALRNSFLKLESLTKKEETPSPVLPPRSTSPTVTKTKKPQTLDEMFCFKLEKNYLMKGIPKGFACAVCLEPNDVVKCSACHNHFHPRCISAKTSSDPKLFKCVECADGHTHRCFVCNDQDATIATETKHRCALSGCGKYYHIHCLRLFPQHKITSTPNSSTLFCPYHTCHTCVSDDPRTNATATRGSLVRCIKCPSSYHPDAKCVPAGSQLLTTSTMICPKHSLEQCSINVNWCFLCCKGGSLICCETCPTAFHLECLQFNPPEGRYICEECESGRMPLYNEIVWAKYSVFKFWPALTIPPPAVPDVVFRRQHERTDICVRFFGTHDFGWINRRRIYLYHEGDSDSVTDRKRSGMMERYNEALREARQVFERLQAEKARAQESAPDDLSFKPPMYVKIKSNKYVAPLRGRNAARDEEEDSICECKPSDTDPCGLDSNCINRALLVECNPKTCPAGESCQNQCFERKQYPALAAKRIPNKGWGLVAQEDIQQGQFVIEYVGEVINGEELARRIKQKQEQKDENYYFLTVDSELTIDAGPKGNLARFINHSCEPNCETLLWKVGGSQSVGLFALKDLKAGEELTFNYNFETFGDQKKICHCGAVKCSGLIGQKYRPPVPEEAPAKAKQGKKAAAKRRRHSIHPAALFGKKRKLDGEEPVASGSGKMKRIKQVSASTSVEEPPVEVKQEPQSP